MELKLETKMDVLKAAMQEDRSEIRLIKDRINNVGTLVPASSFAVTAFLLDPKNSIRLGHGWPFFLLIDVSFLLLFWVIFIRLLIDLRSVRRCLDARETLIRTVANAKGKFDPFPPVDRKVPPKISEYGLFWIAGIASLVMAMKLVMVCWLLRCQGG